MMKTNPVIKTIREKEFIENTELARAFKDLEENDRLKDASDSDIQCDPLGGN